MRNRVDITAEQARAMLDYNVNTGEFTWKIRPPEMFEEGNAGRAGHAKTWNVRFAGKIAGAVDANGYVTIVIYTKRFYAHRLAFLIIDGEWPKNEIDHINGNRADNRLCNLRHAVRGENTQNIKRRRNNTSGYIGVSWCPESSNWVARIAVSGKQHNLGRFASKEDAYAAYLRAKARLHTFQPTPRGDRDEQAA